MAGVHYFQNPPESIKNALDEFAAEQNVPMRLLFGRFRTTPVPPWTEDEASNAGVSLAVAQERGVTLIHWGASSQMYGREWNTFPGEFYMDNVERELEIRDIVVPQLEGTRQAIPYHVGGADAPDIGEFGDRSVWYFANLDHIPDPDILDIDTFLIEPIRRSMDPNRMEEFLAEVAEQSAIAFAEAMEREPEARMETLVERIQANETQARQHEQSLLTVRTQLEQGQRELDTMLSGLKQDPEVWKEQWRKIALHPLIAPNTLSMNELTVRYDTVPLEIEDNEEGDKIPLGSMRITINLTNNSVSVENLTQRIRNRDHPHVENNQPCWGGYASELLGYMRERQIAALVEFIFGYLQSYNPDDDWGRYIRWWREAAQTAAATA